MKQIRILGNCQHWRLGTLSRKSGPHGNGVMWLDDSIAAELIAAGAAISMRAEATAAAPKPKAGGEAQPLSVSPPAPVFPPMIAKPSDGGEYETKVQEPVKRRRGRKPKGESLL